MATILEVKVIGKDLQDIDQHGPTFLELKKKKKFTKFRKYCGRVQKVSVSSGIV